MAPSSTIRIGSAPDSWGVWFPSDPDQTPADRFLSEVSGAGPSVLAFAGQADDLSSYAPRGWSVEVLAVDAGGAELLGLAG